MTPYHFKEDGNMVKAGVKAIFSKDKLTVTTWTYPSKSGYAYKLTKKTWKNKCPFCGGTFKFNPKATDEGELTCRKCDADFCGVSGKDKAKKVRKILTPATANVNYAVAVAGSQTQSQQCSLTKVEALTKAKSLLKTNKSFNATMEIPILKNINLTDLISVNLKGFANTKKKTLHIAEIKENIDNQTYTITISEGKFKYNNKYEGSYILKNKNGAILNKNSNNPLNAKCSKVNINIGLKDNSPISKKIKLKGQALGTVDKIYKWLRVKAGGGTGGWTYKKYANHRVTSEKNTDKFAPLSAEKCWNTKTANCTDFAWIMAKMGEGAGKPIGVKKGTYTNTSGKQQGHMWNYCGSKYYDCSSATGKTPDWKKVEKVK